MKDIVKGIVKGIAQGIDQGIDQGIVREMVREMVRGIMVLPCHGPGLCPIAAESTGAWTVFLDHVVGQPAIWLVSFVSNDTSPLPVQ